MTYPVGIDLGTSNSVASVWYRGEAVVVPVEGHTTLPSAISVKPDGNVLIGLAAKSRAQIEPANSVMSVKRFIGDGKTKWKIEGKTYTPVDVSSMVLRRLKQAAEEYLKQSVTKAVVTVPAYFSHTQKQDTKLAAEAVGLEVLQLLPEPTAAAVHYGLNQGKDQTLLVYDLGGGTFDVSVLKVKDNQFDVVGVDGDFHLGGDDFDMLLVDYLIGLIEKQTKKDLGFFRALCQRKKKQKNEEAPSHEMLLARLRLKEVAEAAKIELSEANRTHVHLPNIMGTSLDEDITIDTYNSLISPMVEQTVVKIHDVLASTKLTTGDIDRVILVGGSTRNRLVKDRVAATVKEPWTSKRVDEIVAQGAAIVAGSLETPVEEKTPVEIEFHNVTPFSLGVCSYERDSSGCINSKIIHKNRPVPCVESRPYELQTRAGQDNLLEVYMLQGEQQNPAECLVIGKYIFSGVSHQPGGLTKVDIQYGYDRNGIITVEAHDQANGKELSLHVENLPEDMAWLDELTNQGQFDPSSLRLLATPAGYDNVGSVLDSLGLPFSVYEEGQTKLDCDIFFWNCLAGIHPEPSIIKDYVSQGGCLYASCCAADKLQGVFPGVIDFERTNCRTETISADILDKELILTLGKSMDIHYNAAACFNVTTLGRDGIVLLRETRSGKDVMMMVPFGKGHIFYTCFHHHGNMSKKEMQLLELLVMKQISVVSGIPIEVVSDEIRS